MRLFHKSLVSSRLGLGLSFHAGGIALARVEFPRNASPILRRVRHISFSEPGDGAFLLKEALRQEDFSRSRCVVALDMGDYQLLQVEAPDVPENELGAALRWQVRDLLSYPVEEAVLDFFTVPHQGSRNRSKVAYAVASQKGVLSRRITFLQDAKVKIEALDIPEMALRNIGLRLPECRQGVALLYLEDHNGVILLIRDGLIYLTRKFGFGLGGLNADENHAGEEGEGVFHDELSERLVLEVQRSLDFFESNFRLSPITTLVIAPPACHGSALFAILQSGLAIPCRWLDLKEIMTVEENLAASERERGLIAVGAALRGVEPQP